MFSSSQLVAFLALFGLSDLAQAEGRRVVLFNETPSNIVAVYASPLGANNWRSDLLGGRPLLSGDSRHATISGGEGSCAYDFRIEMQTPSGIEIKDHVQDLCTQQFLKVTP